MKKVICIDAENIVPCICGRSANNISEGESYDVIGETNTKKSWILSGRDLCKCGAIHGFFKWRFIPLSGIDETELVNEFLTEKA